MIQNIYWKGDIHMCADIVIIHALNNDTEKYLYDGGLFRYFTLGAQHNVPFKALIDIKRMSTEQILTPRCIEIYENAYKKLHGRVLHLGLGLNYGEYKIECDEMIFVEESIDVIDNVHTRHKVIHGDASDIDTLNSLGTFDTIFLDITKLYKSTRYDHLLNEGGQVISIMSI